MILMALFNKHAAWLATEVITGIVLIAAVTIGWFWLYNQLEKKPPTLCAIFLVLSILIGGWLFMYFCVAATDNVTV